VLQLQSCFGHEEGGVDAVGDCFVLLNPLLSLRVASGQQDAQERNLGEADLACCRPERLDGCFVVATASLGDAELGPSGDQLVLCLVVVFFAGERVGIRCGLVECGGRVGPRGPEREQVQEVVCGVVSVRERLHAV